MVIVCSNQWVGFTSWWDPYTIEVNRRNRNCYNYRGFGYLARNYRNREIGNRIGKRRRLEYRGNNTPQLQYSSIKSQQQ